MVTEKELIQHLEKVILILKEEVSAGNLTELQYHDYVRMIRYAADRVFVKHRKLWREVDHMTKPMLRLPSMEYRELEEELAEQKAKNTEQEAKIAEQEAEIKRLKEKLRLAESK